MEINGEIVSENVRYADLGLSEPIMKALEKKGYEQATPVQGGAIPYFMEYKDVIAKAPTGTGKTFAFGIPMVEHIDPESSDVLALVLAPTRELAIQIRDELRDLCAFKEGVRTVCLYGGQLLLCGGQPSGLLAAWTVGAAGGVMAGAGRLPGSGVCPGHPLFA